VKRNIALLYGFSFFDQFMIVIALWVPYLATQYLAADGEKSRGAGVLGNATFAAQTGTTVTPSSACSCRRPFAKRL
jgi:hypothetical protein